MYIIGSFNDYMFKDQVEVKFKMFIPKDEYKFNIRTSFIFCICNALLVLFVCFYLALSLFIYVINMQYMAVYKLLYLHCNAIWTYIMYVAACYFFLV